MTRKIVSEMTYNVSTEMLSPTIALRNAFRVGYLGLLLARLKGQMGSTENAGPPWGNKKDERTGIAGLKM